MRMKKGLCVALAVVIFAMAAGLVGCARTEDIIIGTWTKDGSFMIESYTFNEDGTVTIKYEDDPNASVSTYKVEGNIIKVSFGDGEKVFKLERGKLYEKGDVLNLIPGPWEKEK